MGTAEASQGHLGKKELTTLHAIGQSLAPPSRSSRWRARS
jgi:hypothetical protein